METLDVLLLDVLCWDEAHIGATRRFTDGLRIRRIMFASVTVAARWQAIRMRACREKICARESFSGVGYLLDLTARARAGYKPTRFTAHGLRLPVVSVETSTPAFR